MTKQKSTDVTEPVHRQLAAWAADCAEHVLPYFELHAPGDGRPRAAIDAARTWALGELPITQARTAAFAAHAAARAVSHLAAKAAARAAGHAAATAHVIGHARHAAAYAMKAVRAAAPAPEAEPAAATERDWQIAALNPDLIAFLPRLRLNDLA